jgi:hypothetical protein
MPEPPAFSESTKRKLRVQWDTLRDKHKLEDEDLSSYDQQRNRVARQWEELRGKHGYDQGRKALSQKARSIGLHESIKAAEVRFREYDREYWGHWCSGGFGYEVYREWLDLITRDVSAEFASIWKGRSDVTDLWLQSTCVPAIEKALGILAKTRIAQARDVETKRLAHSPQAKDSAPGNSSAPEIRARATDPESTGRLIESGDESLTPPAQSAVKLARIQMKQLQKPSNPSSLTQERNSADSRASENVIKLPTSEQEPASATPVGASDELYQKAPVFVYDYPDDFPSSGQFAIENARREANKQFEDKGIVSFEEHVTARIEWFWRIVSGVASAIGEIPATEQWSVKRRREMLRDFSLKAADAAGLLGRRSKKLMESQRWQALDDDLFPASEPSVPPKGETEMAADAGSQPTEEVVTDVPDPEDAKPASRVGRPMKELTSRIKEAWVELGRPKVTANICDKIGKVIFAEELEESAPGSVTHKRVRERVRQAILRTPRR